MEKNEKDDFLKGVKGLQTYLKDNNIFKEAEAALNDPKSKFRKKLEGIGEEASSDSNNVALNRSLFTKSLKAFDANGLLNKNVDGDYGHSTQLAVAYLQFKSDIKVDGAFGAGTMEVIKQSDNTSAQLDSLKTEVTSGEKAPKIDQKNLLKRREALDLSENLDTKVRNSREDTNQENANNALAQAINGIEIEGYDLSVEEGQVIIKKGEKELARGVISEKGEVKGGQSPIEQRIRFMITNLENEKEETTPSLDKDVELNDTRKIIFILNKNYKELNHQLRNKVSFEGQDFSKLDLTQLDLTADMNLDGIIINESQKNQLPLYAWEGIEEDGKWVVQETPTIDLQN